MAVILTSHPWRPLHQPDQIALGIEKAGDDAAIGNGVRTEGLLSALAFDKRQRGAHVPTAT